MSHTLLIENQFTINGRVYRNTATVSEEGMTSKIVSLSTAKTGQLTTRTDNDTGELTMAGGHGITDGDRLDVYWATGSRRGMTVGTVDVNDVPIDGGAGDNLPDNLTSVTAMVAVEEEFLLTGDNLKALVLSGNQKCSVSLCGADDAEDYGVEIGSATDSGRTFLWYAEDPNAPTNPVAGDTVTKVFLSNSSSSSAAEVKVEALTT